MYLHLSKAARVDTRHFTQHALIYRYKLFSKKCHFYSLRSRSRSRPCYRPAPNHFLNEATEESKKTMDDLEMRLGPF
jgi:hypothetical protein